jgi:hypothetical protein
MMVAFLVVIAGLSAVGALGIAALVLQQGGRPQEGR